VSETLYCKTLTLCVEPDSESVKLLDHPKKGKGPQKDTQLPQNPSRLVFRQREFSLPSVNLSLEEPGERCNVVFALSVT
jgi:hypothetical protein